MGTPVNTHTHYDPLLFVVFVLGMLGPANDLAARILERFDRNAALDPLQAKNWAMGVSLIGILAVCLLVQRKVLSRIIGSRTYDVARAGFMAIAGGVVLCVLCLMVAILVGLATSLLPAGGLCDLIAQSVFLVAFFLGFALGGFWSGWRFGKLGSFWGAGVAIFILAAICGARAIEMATLHNALLASGGLIAAMLGGRRGTRRFERKAEGSQPAASIA